MKHYVGIDLGTTNSAICTYDGEQTRIWKSREQNDVTPSAIFIDKRIKHIGKNAYDSAPWKPGNVALRFKPYMGTNTPIKLPARSITMTPEECSAEVLRTLFGYLPEELWGDEGMGTVITVPAAFNQMKKSATRRAAEIAGVRRVELLQEPVAAVMSVLKANRSDGMFIIYDLGGGTLDVAIADSMRGRINIQAHGGIESCGGRDFDRMLFDNVVRPWMMKKFSLEENIVASTDYSKLKAKCLWATERAKIDLSSRPETVICLSEEEMSMKDRNGNEMYLDIPLSRNDVDAIIKDKVAETIDAARKTLDAARLTAGDLDRIVFIGGPTNYKPLRDMISHELGLPASTEINPMTAVAEGAALFAESIEWASEERGPKSRTGELKTNGKLKPIFRFTKRTADTRAKIAIEIKEDVAEGTEFQIDCQKSGWTSGRIPLKNKASIRVPLVRDRENVFRAFVFDEKGGVVRLDDDRIVIESTIADVEGIPVSQSVGIECLESLGGSPMIVWLAKAGDGLPMKGSKRFKAGESLKAQSTGELNFKLLEGESDEPRGNRYIGNFKVAGKDFDDGVIPAGGEILCEYNMPQTGEIELKVSVPSIMGTFKFKNYYDPGKGGRNYDDPDELRRIIAKGEKISRRLSELKSEIPSNDLRINRVEDKLELVARLSPDQQDVDRAQEADEAVLEAEKILEDICKGNKNIKQKRLNDTIEFHSNALSKHARDSERKKLENLARTMQRSLDRDEGDFEIHLNEYKGYCFKILFRQDWFAIKMFELIASSPYNFARREKYSQLVDEGKEAINRNDMDGLRRIVAQLHMLKIDDSADPDAIIISLIQG